MGWALKTITKTRFTQKQNEFLKQQFEIGEQSGRKADPNEVSKMMRSSRDELGARRFLPEEVLTGQQITGFFSRLAAKKRLPPSTVNREESDEETTREDDRASQEQVIQSEICAQVMREVSLQHPNRELKQQRFSRRRRHHRTKKPGARVPLFPPKCLN